MSKSAQAVPRARPVQIRILAGITTCLIANPLIKGSLDVNAQAEQPDDQSQRSARCYLAFQYQRTIEAEARRPGSPLDDVGVPVGHCNIDGRLAHADGALGDGPQLFLIFETLSGVKLYTDSFPIRHGALSLRVVHPYLYSGSAFR